MPMHSMTSYGFGEAEVAGFNYSLEIRTLNSRYIEVNVRMPRHLISLEAEMIGIVKSRLNRGKVDVFVDVTRDGGGREYPDLDPQAVKHYAHLFDKLQAALSETLISSFASLQDPTAADFFRLEGVLRSGEKKPKGVEVGDEQKAPLLQALNHALDQVVIGRAKEGEAMSQHLTEMLTVLAAERDEVAAKRDSILKYIHDNYRRKLDALFAMIKGSAQAISAEVPEERIAQEIVILTDKADIEEELARLKTHYDEFRKCMEQEDVVGRKLDFLCQEMHREVNTMTNKLVQTEVSKHTLNMKQTVERIRQQVQNIE